MINADQGAPNSRFEFRVWGDSKTVRKRLSRLADVELREQLDDCYLLVSDPRCNAKIRENQLKVKRLIGERLGFQRWSSMRHRAAANAPEPFSKLVTDLTSARALDGDYRRSVAKMVGRLERQHDVRPVFVTKDRRRFRFGSVRAEVAKVKVTGRPGRLSTIAIEGSDLLELVSLRNLLGLNDLPNLALHLAVDPQYPFSRPSGRLMTQSSVSVRPSSR